MYEQIDGVIMGATPGPVLANKIMTEEWRHLNEELMKDKIVIFYARYVNNTLLIIKKKTSIMFQFNLIILIDTFDNCVPHFLDIEIYPNGLGICHKHTQTGQYVHIHSYISWRDEKLLGSVH